MQFSSFVPACGRQTNVEDLLTFGICFLTLSEVYYGYLIPSEGTAQP
jgi:hypothetical protein